MDVRDSDNSHLAHSEQGAKIPPLLGRKSVLMGMLTSGFVIANAARPPEAVAGGTVKPIAATQPLYAPKWTPNTPYQLGQQVISPNNDVVSAKAAHRSSTTYPADTAKWMRSSTYGRTFHLDLRDYGLSTGMGQIDDTAAFAAAIAAAKVLGANAVLHVPAPAGFGHLIMSTLATFPGLRIAGVRSGRTDRGGSVLLNATGGPLFRMGNDDGLARDRSGYDGVEGFTLENLSIKGWGAVSVPLNNGAGNYFPGSIGISDWRGGDVLLDNVLFDGLDYAFWGVQSDINTFRRVQIRSCHSGFYLGPRSDQNTFEHCYFVTNDRAVTIDAARGTVFDSPVFDNNGAPTTNPVTITNASSAGTIAQNTTFNEAWFEHYALVPIVEAFVEVGVGDTHTVGSVNIHNPMILTNSISSGAPHTQYLLKTGNSDRIKVEITAEGNTHNLVNFVKSVGSVPRGLTIEAPDMAPHSGSWGFPATYDTGMLRGTDFTTLAPNQAVFLRVRDGGVTSKIGLEIAVTGGNISVAVYANSGFGRTAKPGARLATSGAVACPSSGYAEIPLSGSVDVRPGDWLCVTVDNATTAFRSFIPGGRASQLGAGRGAIQEGAHPAPASPAPYPIEGNSIVLIGVP